MNLNMSSNDFAIAILNIFPEQMLTQSIHEYTKQYSTIQEARNNSKF